MGLALVVEGVVIRAEEHRLVIAEALETLTECQREVLCLTMVGYTQDEVAGALGITRQAVSDRYRRAIQKLRRNLEGEPCYLGSP